MNVEDVYHATQATRKALIALGYTSADCRISFNMAGPILITAEATQQLSKMFFVEEPTSEALEAGLAEVEAWIHQIPNAKERAKQEFLIQLPNLISQAKDFGIEFPVKLAS